MRAEAKDFNEGRTTDRQWAELLATDGQFRDRLWAGSHGRRQFATFDRGDQTRMSVIRIELSQSEAVLSTLQPKPATGTTAMGGITTINSRTFSGSQPRCSAREMVGEISRGARARIHCAGRAVP
jgi:hypothetical protein